jgi:4-amino-4-deoxy-L-arabinose transferase-like glycosyltransferase
MRKLEITLAIFTVAAVAIVLLINWNKENAFVGEPMSKELLESYSKDPNAEFYVLSDNVIVKDVDPAVHYVFSDPQELADFLAEHQERVTYFTWTNRLHLGLALVGIIIGVLLIIYWITALYLLLTKRLEPQISWLLILLLLPPIGAIIYRVSEAKKSS